MKGASIGCPTGGAIGTSASEMSEIDPELLAPRDTAHLAGGPCSSCPDGNPGQARRLHERLLRIWEAREEAPGSPQDVLRYSPFLMR